jgi:hypothetical protein
MKRIDLIRHLERHGVQFLREGGSHSVYVLTPTKVSNDNSSLRTYLHDGMRTIHTVIQGIQGGDGQSVYR